MCRCVSDSWSILVLTLTTVATLEIRSRIMITSHFFPSHSSILGIPYTRIISNLFHYHNHNDVLMLNERIQNSEIKKNDGKKFKVQS